MEVELKTRWLSANCIIITILLFLSACAPPLVDPYPPAGVEQAPVAINEADPSAVTPTQANYPPPTTEMAPPTGPFSAEAAYRIALQYAQKEWKSDAQLTHLETLEGGNRDGTAPTWQMNFHSPSRRLEYLALQIRDGQIAFAMPRDSSGPGKPLYAQDWMDSTQAAALVQPFCSTADDGTFYYSLDVNLQGGIEWLVSCGSGEAQRSVRLNAINGDIQLDWFGGLDAEPKP